MEVKNEWRKAHRRKVKAWLDEIRNVPCIDCQGKFPPECMDFDHIPGEEKLFGVMNKYGDVKKEALLAEIAKCEIVCSNCHRIRTASRR